jgi:hypothetical protein
MSSHSELRKENSCLNCGFTVDLRYCGNCGQENIEPRRKFGELIFHFFEDLTHYEGKFWKTMRILVLRPGQLSVEYLQGKRMSHVPPVRLYIFISFLAFFIPYLLPDSKMTEAEKERIIKENKSDPSQAIDFSFTFSEGFYIDLPYDIQTESERDSLMKDEDVFNAFWSKSHTI